MRAALFLALALAACGPSAPPKEDAAPQAPAPTQAPTSTATTSVEETLAAMPSWETARAQGVDFRAVGQEPGWLLDIHTADRMVLVWDYGSNRLETPRGEPASPQEGATRYEGQSGGHTLIVTIRRTPCQDAMSGQPYPSTVEVVIDGRTLNGCGRSV
jgi:uncharacterized membrane protein